MEQPRNAPQCQAPWQFGDSPQAPWQPDDSVLQEFICVPDAYPDMLYAPTTLAKVHSRAHTLMGAATPPPLVPELCPPEATSWGAASPPLAHSGPQEAWSLAHSGPQEAWSLAHMSHALQDTQVLLNLHPQARPQELPHHAAPQQQAAPQQPQALHQELPASPQAFPPCLPHAPRQQQQAVHGDHQGPAPLPAPSPMDAGYFPAPSPLQEACPFPPPSALQDGCHPSPLKAGGRLTPCSPRPAGAGARRGRRASRERRPRLYERTEQYPDQLAEKRRLDAINSKKNREARKVKMSSLRRQVVEYTATRDQLHEQVEALRRREADLLTQLTPNALTPTQPPAAAH
ncbi:hypothetical protein GWK47_006855 [Chionoecetes opilio]|uniref:BZIP domain-containing protein n=1 Tax=Chionoecetes opilio TaxID=41210 RepID=A0A8J4YBN1_CHIOP|nr:hypothetical protein GWK47_006855 [Chionoecetes opilio]